MPLLAGQVAGNLALKQTTHCSVGVPRVADRELLELGKSELRRGQPLPLAAGQLRHGFVQGMFLTMTSITIAAAGVIAAAVGFSTATVTCPAADTHT